MIAALLSIVVFKLWETGAFIWERSADICLEYVFWNGKEYSPISGEYTEGRTLAKGENDWVINMVEEDPSHTFNENGSPKKYPIGRYVIPEEYHAILSKYFS